MERKLTSLFMADAVSSTAAMALDEEAAVLDIGSRLKTIRSVVERNNGRVFNKSGDSIFAEFASPKNAVLAALEARARLAALGVPKTMRFGLHLADVVIDGQDLLGDGVNLTARIQSDADPGDILVSEALFVQIKRVSPCTFDEPQERRLKGVVDPVTVYRVKEKMHRHVFQTEASRAPSMTARRPNSVAVVPFRTTSLDEDQAFLADGFSEDLILELSRVQGLFVVSRTAANELRDRDPVDVGTRAGVGFVLTGSVRKFGKRVRLSVTLFDSNTGEIVWSDRIQRSFDELLDVMDEVVSKVAATVIGRMEEAEIKAARLKRPDSMTAYEYYLRGMDLHRMGGVTMDHYRQAVEWFERAIDEDPNFSRGYCMKACAGSNLPGFDIEMGEYLVNKALLLDPQDAEAHRIMGNMQILFYRDYDKALMHYEKAMQNAPSNAFIVGRNAAFHIFNGYPERGLKMLDQAVEMEPFLPVWILEDRMRALYSLKDYDQMFACARTFPFQTLTSRIYRAVAYSKLGYEERASQLIAATLADDPEITSDYLLRQELYRDNAITEEIVNRAERAGLPSQPTM